VEIQASVLQGLIDGISFPHEPDWAKAALVLLTVALGIGLSLTAPALSAGWLMLTSLAILAPLLIADVWLWTEHQLAFSPVAPVLLVLVIGVFNGARGFFSEAEMREELRDMFGQYVPEGHINSMLANPDSVTFEGETREMSVLFADIRNFTTISEGLEVGELKQMLNDFFTPITEIIFEHQGTIDKYIGDLVMAFWGAPLEDRDHRRHAISAALEMLKKVEELKPEFRQRGLPEINIGIGINSGMMNVGDMGSTYRRAYTVIGDAVNLASRLEGLTKYYGVSLLVGEEVRREEDQFLYRYIDKVQVKGKEHPIQIFEPLCLRERASGELLERLAIHNEAMKLYMTGMLKESREHFMRLEQLAHHKQYEIMLQRIAELEVAGSGEAWTGAFRHTQK
jgi:adenylate cyclase